MNRRSLVQMLLSGLLALRIFPGTLIPSLRLRDDDLLSAWARYVAEPTDRNAQAVLDLLPEYQVGSSAAERRVAEHVDRTLSVLEARVLEGHRLSAHLAVRLLTVTDGAVSECLDMIIGRYIHVDPQHFLTLLSQYRHFGGFSKMYCNFGFDLVDDFAGQEREACRRIRAVETVDAPDLQPIKARVVRDLSTRLPRDGSAVA